MKNGKLTQEGAERINAPHLANKIVQYEINENNNFVTKDVFYMGEKIAGTVFIGPHGIIPI